MGNKTNNVENSLIIKEEKIKTKIICPKCPLIPIINITSTKEGTLICEYRCPSFHMGIVKIEEMIFNKNNKNKKHGFICETCQKKISEEIINEKRFKFCGICKMFLCAQCIEEHNKIKTNHKILNYSEINNLCLEHQKNFKFYCFTCLKSLCTKCSGHSTHSYKDLLAIEPNEEFFDKLEYYFNEIHNYFNSIEKLKINNDNREKYLSFKKKNIFLLNFVKSLYKKYLQKKIKNSLNGEIIINLINLTKFNLNTKQLYINQNLYFDSHLIIENIPVSSICSFTYSKANYKVGELTPLFFKDLNIENYESMIVLRMDYDLIAYNLEEILYFMKDEEEVYFKVSIPEKIINFGQLKEHIVGICSDENIYFYKLLKLEPYIVKLNVSIPYIENVFQVYGNIYDTIYALNNENIYKIINKKNKKEINTEYDFNLEIGYLKNINFNTSFGKDNNNNSKENVNEPDASKEEEDEEEEEEEKEDNEKLKDSLIKCLEKYEKKEEKSNKNIRNFCIKGIVFNFIILAENFFITIRNKNNFQIKKALKTGKFNFIIYNEHILLPDNNNINFYSIPSLKLVSIINVSETIHYFSIPNKYMLLLIGKHSIEQLELNTWKKVSKFFNKDFDFIKENSKIIGNNKELYLFEKDEIYKFEKN